MKDKFCVYKITYNNKVIYIGHTNCLLRREKEHTYHLKKGTTKEVYDYLRTKNITSIKLQVLRTFKTKVESKRFEMLMILMYHFAGHRTLQKIPSISDR